MTDEETTVDEAEPTPEESRVNFSYAWPLRGRRRDYRTVAQRRADRNSQRTKGRDVTRVDHTNTGGPRQCTAKSKMSGERCKNPPLIGGFVCRKHGGNTPAAIRGARARLLELVEPSIATLNEERIHAKRSADRQRAANSILDRAGISRVRTVDAGESRQLLLDRLRELRQPREAITSGREDIIDAEVIEDDGTHGSGVDVTAVAELTAAFRASRGALCRASIAPGYDHGWTRCGLIEGHEGDHQPDDEDTEGDGADEESGDYDDD